MKRSSELNIIAIIPARGGSKRVPRKNLQPVRGKPLISYTIEQAKASALLDNIFVSTDDESIASVSREFGASVIERPSELATDEAQTEDSMLHAVEEIQKMGHDPQIITLLQCTSPMRRINDIDEAISIVTDEGYDSVVSCCKEPGYTGFSWHMTDSEAVPLNYDPRDRPLSQKKEPEYYENGSIYVVRTSLLTETRCRLGGQIGIYNMPKPLSFEIDTWEDLAIVEAIMPRFNFYEKYES
jgi:N-acylneuraminate cytidylyltransferase